MLQTSFNFPKFVGDQVLTAAALNDLESYLEEQERRTRTNLLGIGIVCGLDITVAAVTGGVGVTVGHGCGVTSEGYLISRDKITYTEGKAFTFTKDNWYAPFCNDINATTLNKFPIVELFPSGETNATPLTNASLTDMVLVMFYDMNNVSGQNCNPESCDGLGVVVETTVRTFLINKTDIDSLHDNFFTYTDEVNANLFYNLADLTMHRPNVEPTTISNSGQLYASYKRLFTESFITNLQNTFSGLYNLIKPLIDTEFESDPFTGFTDKYKFIYDGSLIQLSRRNDLINLQYYYGHMIDLMNSFAEIKERGFELTGNCCPPSTLFPRHLYAGLFVLDSSTSPAHMEISTPVNYYHSFMPSLIMGGYRKAASEIIMLFRRLVLQYTSFTLPTVSFNNNQSDPQLDSTIRITPTISGPEPLSRKAIPFYYNVPGSSPRLHENWNYKLKISNKNYRNLSYHASSYANDNDVLVPFAYDLEPYNFVRVEGHIGKPLSTVLYNIQALRKKYQVPFEVTVVTTGSNGVDNEDILKDLRKFRTIPRAVYADLEQAYDSTMAEIVDTFLKAARVTYDSLSCLYFLMNDGAPVPTKVPFLLDADPSWTVKAKTNGKYFEDNIWPPLSNKPYTAPVNLSVIQGLEGLDNSSLGIAGWAAYFAPSAVYIMDKIYSTMKDGLDSFASQMDQFSQCYADLEDLCTGIDQFIATSYKAEGTATKSDLFLENLQDALNSLLLLSKGIPMRIIGEEYYTRMNEFARDITFSGFSEAHPGMQHRAGVPIGGTFILVAHYKPVTPTTTTPTVNPPVKVENKFARWNKGYKSLAKQKALKDVCKDCAPQFNLASQAGNQYGILNMAQFDMVFWDRIKLLFANVVDDSIALENALAEIPDGTIITDWFLPYLISSEVPPAKFSLSLNDTPLFLDINPKTVMLDGDNTQLGVLRYGPPGGTLTFSPAYSAAHMGDFSPSDFNNDYGPGNPANFDAHYFLPFDGLKEDVTITYTKDSQVVTTKTTIYKKPLSVFSEYSRVRNSLNLTPAPANSTGKYSVTFTYASSENYDRLAWSWGDGAFEDITTFNSNKRYTHVFDNSTKTHFTVVLTAFNGSYMSISTVTIYIPLV